MSNTLYSDLLENPFHYQTSTFSEDYIVSREGVVLTFNEDRTEHIKRSIFGNGTTSMVAFQTDNGPMPLHSEVGTLFVPNPNPEVFTSILHKDGNRLNNRAENLMWVTSRERNAWYVDQGYSNRRRSVFINCIETNEFFDSVVDAADRFGVSHATVRRYLKEGKKLKDTYTIREYDGTERIKFWLSNPARWAKHPKFSNYLVAEDGLVIRLDSDGGLGDPLRIYIRPDGTRWVKTRRKEDLEKLLDATFGAVE